MPAIGLKYQARPERKKKAALSARETCSEFFKKLVSGRRPSTSGWPSVVATTPTTITIAACVIAV